MFNGGPGMTSASPAPLLIASRRWQRGKMIMTDGSGYQPQSGLAVPGLTFAGRPWDSSRTSAYGAHAQGPCTAPAPHRVVLGSGVTAFGCWHRWARQSLWVGTRLRFGAGVVALGENRTWS